MANVVRAAAVQLSPVLGSREGTVEKVVAAIRDAASKGAELCVFPETVVPYYPYFSFIRPPAAAMGKDTCSSTGKPWSCPPQHERNCGCGQRTLNRGFHWRQRTRPRNDIQYSIAL